MDADTPAAIAPSPATTPFVETQCEIGGCACSIWNDWYWSAREVAQNTPDMVRLGKRYDRGRVSESRYDAAVSEEVEAMLADGRYVYPAPPCPRPTCARYSPTAQEPADVAPEPQG